MIMRFKITVAYTETSSAFLTSQGTVRVKRCRTMYRSLFIFKANSIEKALLRKSLLPKETSLRSEPKHSRRQRKALLIKYRNNLGLFMFPLCGALATTSELLSHVPQH